MTALPYLRVLSGSANEDAAQCGPCGGACCQNGPGVCAPTDFEEPLTKSLEAAFRSGQYRAMPVKGRLVVLPHATTSMGLISAAAGPCALLTDTGCSLPAEKRPTECRELVPSFFRPERSALPGNERWGCYQPRSGYDIAKLWEPLQEEILSAICAAEKEPPEVVHVAHQTHAAPRYDPAPPAKENP